MGRYSGYGHKTELEGLLYLDMPKLKKCGLLKGNSTQSIIWTNHFDGARRGRILLNMNLYTKLAQLTYTATDNFSKEKTDYDYTVVLENTPCNLGGIRWWFICPLVVGGVRCGRRVRVLYNGSGYFGCRTCQELCYSSQNVTSKYRDFYLAEDLADKAEKLFLEMRTPYYKGKATRKMKRYKKLVRGSDYYTARMPSIDELLRKM
jgi:hypothetical protein